jgi:hypothetical protein
VVIGSVDDELPGQGHALAAGHSGRACTDARLGSDAHRRVTA